MMNDVKSIALYALERTAIRFALLLAGMTLVAIWWTSAINYMFGCKCAYIIASMIDPRCGYCMFGRTPWF